jgi:hypothetical protein
MCARQGREKRQHHSWMYFVSHCDPMHGGRWMEIEREEVDRGYNWALVSAIVLEIRDQGLTCFMPTDRVQAASLD